MTDWASIVCEFGSFLGIAGAAGKTVVHVIDNMLKRNETLEKQRTENLEQLFQVVREQTEANSKLNATLHSVVMAELENCHLRNTKLETKIESLQQRIDEVYKNNQ